MLEVTIPCHPLTRRFILAEHGPEPVEIDRKRPRFGMLAGYAVGDVPIRNSNQFTAYITLLLPDNLAAHVAAMPFPAAERMYQYDKERVAWYAYSSLRAKGKGAARPAVRDCLDLYQVEEDEYSLDTAFKAFQRIGWEISEKNSRFLGQMKTKTAEFLSQKSGRRAKFYPVLRTARYTCADIEVELCVNRFMAAYTQQFSTTPARLEKHVRAYAYRVLQRQPIRAIAAKLNEPRMTIQNAIAKIRSRATRNRTFSLLLQQIIALPQPAESPAP